MENYHTPVGIISHLIAENNRKRMTEETYAPRYRGTIYHGMPADVLTRSVARAQTGGVSL